MICRSSFVENLKTIESARSKMTDLHPLVSIIMPVRNEAEYIALSLGSIAEQSYPMERIEVLVADGMSDDGTRQAILDISAATGLDVKILDNAKRIAPSGLNVAMDNAKGDIVIRVDGHCELDPNYVENCVELLQSNKAEGVGGPIETIGEGLTAEAIAIAMSSKFGVGGSAFRTVDDRELYTDTVAFPGYKRETIEKAGRFAEELVRNQDDEYNFRIREAGGRILLSPLIRSRYFSRSSFRSLWRQYFQYGYWKVRVLQLHPRQMSPRQFIPFVFVVTLLLLGVASIFLEIARWGLLAVIALYALANLTASIVAAKANVLKTPLVGFSFFILHLSYGLGSLFGLVAFRDRWRDPSLTTGIV